MVRSRKGPGSVSVASSIIAFTLARPSLRSVAAASSPRFSVNSASRQIIWVKVPPRNNDQPRCNAGSSGRNKPTRPPEPAEGSETVVALLRLVRNAGERTDRYGIPSGRAIGQRQVAMVGKQRIQNGIIEKTLFLSGRSNDGIAILEGIVKGHEYKMIMPRRQMRNPHH